MCRVHETIAVLTSYLIVLYHVTNCGTMNSSLALTLLGKGEKEINKYIQRQCQCGNAAILLNVERTLNKNKVFEDNIKSKSYTKNYNLVVILQ